MSTSFSDLILKTVRAQTEASRIAYEAGYAAGHHQGYLEAMAEAKQMVKASQVAVAAA